MQSLPSRTSELSALINTNCKPRPRRRPPLGAQTRCSSSCGTPMAFCGWSFGQAPEGTRRHAAAGIWEHMLKTNPSKVVALPRTSIRSAAPSAPLLSRPKHLVQGVTGRNEQQRENTLPLLTNDNKVTLWQLTLTWILSKLKLSNH